MLQPPTAPPPAPSEGANAAGATDDLPATPATAGGARASAPRRGHAPARPAPDSSRSRQGAAPPPRSARVKAVPGRSRGVRVGPVSSPWASLPSVRRQADPQRRSGAGESRLHRPGGHAEELGGLRLG